MTASRRFEQDLPALIADTYLAGTPDYRDDLIWLVERTPQRPAWMIPGRWLPMDLITERVATPRAPWRALATIALIALLIAALAAAYVGSQPRVPAPFGIVANGLIVSSENGDIVARDTVDGASRVLIGRPEHDIAIGFAPAGDRLLIGEDDGANHLALWVAAPNGSDLKRIGGPYDQVSRVEWAPDGTRIAVSHQDRGADVVTIVRSDGTGEQRLAMPMGVDNATWRPPDGQELAVRGELGANWTLFLVRPDGSNVRQLDIPRALLEAPFEALSPAWSPTGTQIAFHRLVDTPGQGNGNGFRISVVDVDPAGVARNSRTLDFDPTSDDEYGVSWLPSGDGLVFTRHEGEADLLSIGTLAATPATRDVGVEADGGYGLLAVTVAPDGRSVFAAAPDSGSAWVVDTGTGVAVGATFRTEDAVQIQRRAP